MKTFITVCIISIISLPIFAQSEYLILTNEQDIGKNNLTQKEIVAKEYLFPERIHTTYIDTAANCITVHLRGTTKNGKYLNSNGDIVVYDLAKNQRKWSKSINYQQSQIEQHSNLMIQTAADKSFCLNSETGASLWEVKNTLNYVDPFQKKGFGYRLNLLSSDDNTLEGIDLTNGKIIWRREISREYGWNDIVHLNDTTVIVAAAGLHIINVNNGTGWDYDAVTGTKDYTAAEAANVAGLALGVLTGTFVLSTGYNLVRDVVSNVLIDSTSIYFASKDKISCLDLAGQVKWSSPLLSHLVSKSSIFKRDSIIYMINKGFAFMGNRQLDYGTPFIAAFDAKTGRQIFLSTMNGFKDQINAFDMQNGTVSIVFKDRVSNYSMLDGSLLIEKSFDTQTYGELNYFIGKQVYRKVDSAFINLALSDTAKRYLYTKTGKTLVLDDRFDVVNQLDYNQLYVCYLSNGDHRFIANDSETVVLDGNNTVVANLDISRRSMKIGSKVYNVREKSFVEVDMQAITDK